MALSDLVIEKKRITEDLLETVLKKYVRLVNGDRDIEFLPESHDLQNKNKVLLYFCGYCAWDFLEKKSSLTPIRISTIEQSLKIEGNTLRPLVKRLKDDGLIEFSEDGYFVNYKGVEYLARDEGKRLEKRSVAKPKDIIYLRKGEIVSNRSHIRSVLENSTLELGYVENLLDVLKTKQNIEKYLIALVAVKNKCNIDGLTAGEINLFLTRPPIKLPKMFTTNISRDLGRNFKTKGWVNPYENAGKDGLVYRITSKGKAHLDSIIGNSL